MPINSEWSTVFAISLTSSCSLKQQTADCYDMPVYRTSNVKQPTYT